VQPLSCPLFQPLWASVESVGDGNISFHPQDISKVMTNSWYCDSKRVSNLMSRYMVVRLHPVSDYLAKSFVWRPSWTWNRFEVRSPPLLSLIHLYTSLRDIARSPWSSLRHWWISIPVQPSSGKGWIGLHIFARSCVNLSSGNAISDFRRVSGDDWKEFSFTVVVKAMLCVCYCHRWIMLKNSVIFVIQNFIVITLLAAQTSISLTNSISLYE
jgi:hypothetical protein